MLDVTPEIEENKEILNSEEIENFQAKQNQSVAENWGLYGILQTVSNADINQLETWLTKPIKMLITNMKYRNDIINEINRNNRI